MTAGMMNRTTLSLVQGRWRERPSGFSSRRAALACEEFGSSFPLGLV